MFVQRFKFWMAGLVLMSAALAEAAECAKPVRGSLVESQELSTLSVEQLNAQLAPLGLQARNAVKLFRVVYETVTPNKAAKPIQASTLIAVPDVPAPVFPWVLIQHFTVLGDREAPTVAPFEGLWEASQGFAAVVPDNLGYGAAAGVYNAYLFAKAYEENGLDALRAARAFSEAESLNFGPLFLKGYSEGAYATLALLQKLESDKKQEFQVVAAAPIAGPYDVSSFRQALLQPQISSIFLNNLILSYETWLTPRLNLDNVYALDVPFIRDLYDGSRIAGEIAPSLPTETKTIFEASFVDDLALEKPKTRDAKLFLQQLTANSLPRGDWTPRTATRFFHCVDDDVVPVELTQTTVGRILQKNPAAPVSQELLASPDPQQPYRHASCPLFYSYLSYFAGFLQAPQ
jgi:pimeloyl-ACP methyl ester carboxylesterase